MRLQVVEIGWLGDEIESAQSTGTASSLVVTTGAAGGALLAIAAGDRAPRLSLRLAAAASPQKRDGENRSTTDVRGKLRTAWETARVFWVISVGDAAHTGVLDSARGLKKYLL